MVLNVVLKSPHEKQAAKFAQEKLLGNNHAPLGCWYAVNLRIAYILHISTVVCGIVCYLSLVLYLCYS